MLTLNQRLVQELLEQAEAEHPLECCGLLVQTASGELNRIAMFNQAQASDYFRFDSKQQLQAWQAIEAQQASLIAIYHSHTASAACPSKLDLRYALAYPELFQVIVTSDPQFLPRLRCYRVQDDELVEVIVQITELREQQ